MIASRVLPVNLMGAAVAATLAFNLMPVAAAHAEGIAGSWSGGGVVTYSSGQRERASCRANYSGGSGGVTMSGTCATPSGSASQSAHLRKVGANSYAGSFFNSQFNASGSIHVTVHGNTQSVSLRSAAGSANLTLRH